MKKALIVLALFSAFAAAPVAEACSVIAQERPPTASEILASKDAIFIGTVASIMQDKSINGEYHITFNVAESYKGSVDGKVTVRAQSSSAACGYDDGYTSFKTGTVWAVFASGNETDGYTTTSVTYNTSYDSVADATEAMNDLGLTPEDEQIACTMQYAPVCGKSTSGETKTYGNSCVLNAEKATFLYDGECKVEGTVPANDLWKGMRSASVTWLQDFLVRTASGSAANALATVGSTGYFGSLTTAALAEFQKEHGISPALGYFGAKTRAFIESMSSDKAETFTGTISAVDTACFADGVCSVTVDGKKVILLAGLRVNIPPVGSLQGVESIGDL
jgi:peptidoglycan hydrolase-like protein with peptidoglycan-binding domain